MKLEGHINLKMRNKQGDIVFEENLTQEEYTLRFWWYVFSRKTLKERIFGRWI